MDAVSNQQTVSTQCSSGREAGGIIHVHPTLRCNLTCKHCYSSSSPHIQGALDADGITEIMKYCRQMSYTILSVSGGEPFLYKDLEKLLYNARCLGMSTQLVTNGTLLGSPIAEKSLPYLDLVAISIDGDEALHDRIRNRQGAYSKAIEGAKAVQEHGVRLGIIHAITESSWRKMIDIAALAYSLGASLLQVHPLEMTGRAIQELPEGLSIDELHKAYILFNYLQEKYAGRMHVQMDCLHRLIIEDNPQICGFYDNAFVPAMDNFYKISNSLIIDETGDILPFSYGINKKFKIGNISVQSQALIEEMFENYLSNTGKVYRDLLDKCYHSYLQSNCDDDLIVWSEYVVKQSYNG